MAFATVFCPASAAAPIFIVPSGRIFDCRAAANQFSYRDIEEMRLERGLEVDHSTLNRWVLAYALLVEKRLRQFRRPNC